MQLAHIDPSLLGQPLISVDKLHGMWSDAVRAWNRSKTNVEASRSNSEFWDFCRGEHVCGNTLDKDRACKMNTLMFTFIFDYDAHMYFEVHRGGTGMAYEDAEPPLTPLVWVPSPALSFHSHCTWSLYNVLLARRIYRESTVLSAHPSPNSRFRP